VQERDANGRFVKGNSVAKGNKGGPGRPKRKREERYYEILVSAVTFEDWRAIVKKAADQARRGDATARKWLADYIVGVPEQTQNVNITGLPKINEIVAELPLEGGDE
jgi:hypothetical protein